MDEATEAICWSLGSSSTVRVGLFLRQLLCVLGIGLNVGLAVVLFTYKAFHPNIRAVLVSYSVAASLYCGSNVVASSNMRAFLDTLPPSSQPNASTGEMANCSQRLICTHHRVASLGRALGVSAMSLGHFALAFERYTALQKAGDYEGRSRPWVAVAGITAQWGVAGAMALPPFLREPIRVGVACVTPAGLVWAILPGVKFPSTSSSSLLVDGREWFEVWRWKYWGLACLFASRLGTDGLRRRA